MDIQRPIPRQKLRADWGRAVADALRAQGLDGPGVLRAPGGTSLPPVQPPAIAQRTEPPPWTVLAAWKAGDGGGGDWVLRVIHGGPVTRGGVPVPAPTPTGSYAGDRPGYTDVSRTAFGGAAGHLVVEAGDTATEWSLRRDADAAGDGYRAIASVSWAAGEAPVVTQLHHGPLELVAGATPGPDASGTAVAKVLGGTDYNAATDSWAYGDIDQTTGLPTYPVYNPTRLYWQESAHTLWMFRRTETHNSSGMLVSVSAEVRTAVFTTVAEMP